MITSFRMYEAVPSAAAAWRALFEQVFVDLGLDIAIIEHRFPQPIDALWAEPELCCAFMWPTPKTIVSGVMRNIFQEFILNCLSE